MFPQEKSPAINRSLQQAFGTTDLEGVQELPQGLSSDLLFRIVVRGASYLLRMMTHFNESMDPGRIFAGMSAAADAGLAPRVRYSSAEDGITITDFVQRAPFPLIEARLQLPRILRRLHALPAFPKAFNYLTAHKGFIWRFREAGLLPKDEIEAVFARYAQVCATYPRVDSDLVSCHNDLKPENIVFDGQRMLLAGWQAAMVNDRYFDLAVGANFLVSTATDEQIYLEQYFGSPPDEYQRARFFLMRQVTHMLSAAIFLLLGSGSKPQKEDDQPPSFSDFHRHIWAGKIDLANADLKKRIWESALETALAKRAVSAIR